MLSHCSISHFIKPLPWTPTPINPREIRSAGEGSAPQLGRKNGAEATTITRLPFSSSLLSSNDPGFLGRPACQVVAVCDVDTNRREDARKRVEELYATKSEKGTFKGCRAFESYHELLANKDIDAVVIATPDHWHALIATHAAESGKDIYCEKPLSKSVQESRAMIQAVRKHKRVFQVGSMQRSSREFRVAAN